ncbi:MAG: hypothetical protein II871_01000 [Clostridia bacterium]|nr:hypothetical protein [Clostridia bacterium]
MMKESIKNCFENADVERLNGYFEKYEGERMPNESLARLRETVLGESVKKPAKKRGFKRLIPALAAAACLLIGLGIAYKAGAFNKPNASAPHKPDTAQSANMGNGEAMKLEVSTNTNDKLDVRNLPSDAVSIFVGADRSPYYYIRFFEDGNKVYAITSEYSGIFSYDGASFTRTGPALSDILYFNSGAYGGHVYIPGSWYCWGNDSGLYRFELKTGKVERFVSTDETVISVAADGPNIYYSSRTGSWYSHDENAAYSLKCVNVETGEIKVLIDNASYSISDLKCVNGNLYFSSYYKGVFYITPDMYLHSILPENVETVQNFAVDGDTVYIERSFPDDHDSDISVYAIEAFDHSGKKLSEYEFKRYWNDKDRKNNQYFGDFTVYNGRLVCYDKNGVYLLDVASGEREKIMDGLWNERDYFSSYYLSETVFNGKLYIGVHGGMVYEYHDGEVKEYDLSKEQTIDASIKLIRYDPYGFGTKVMTLPPSELTTSIINYLAKNRGSGEVCEKLSDEAFDENASYMPAEPGTLWLEVYSDIYRVSPDFDKIWRVDGHFGEGTAINFGTLFFGLIEDAWYEDYQFDFNPESEYDRPIIESFHHTFDGGSIDVNVKSIETRDEVEPANVIILELVSSVDLTVDIKLECTESIGGTPQCDSKRVELKAGIGTELELAFDGWPESTNYLTITIGNMRMEIDVAMQDQYYFTYHLENGELALKRRFSNISGLQFEILKINEGQEADNGIVLQLTSPIDQAVVILTDCRQDGGYYAEGGTEIFELKASEDTEIVLDLDKILSGTKKDTPYLIEITMLDAVIGMTMRIEVMP